MVGVVSDEQTTANKGQPVMSQHEREAMIRSVKWVDEVISGEGPGRGWFAGKLQLR